MSRCPVHGDALCIAIVQGCSLWQPFSISIGEQAVLPAPVGSELDQLRAKLAAVQKERDDYKRELQIAQQNNHRRHVELDALHYVWCDGGCATGVHRFGEHPPLTEEIVRAAENNALRLRRWLENARAKGNA